jgi:hypothetical protein
MKEFVATFLQLSDKLGHFPATNYFFFFNGLFLVVFGRKLGHLATVNMMYGACLSTEPRSQNAKPRVLPGVHPVFYITNAVG